MSRTRKIIWGIVAAIVVAVLAGAYAINGALYGIPGFVAWRSVTSEFHGGKRAAVNGISLYYETYGEGRPVLILHGATAFLEVMHYQIRSLANDHRVIAVDSRAQGRSTDAPGPITYAGMGDDMIKLLDILHIKQVDVVGWSDGGIIGLDMAMKHPTRVRRLVAIGANYDVNGVDAKQITPGFEADIESQARPVYDRIAPDPSHFPVMLKKIITMIRTEPHYTTAELATIKAKTLIIAGENDLILRKHTDSLAQAIPGAKEVIVPGASHEGLLEQPDRYNAMIREFLDAP